MQHTVDPVAHTNVLLGRLDVDVRRPVLHRLGDEQVDELDDRGVLHHLLHRGEVLFVLPFARGFGGDVLDIAVHAVVAVDGVQDRRAGRDDGSDLCVGDRADVVDREDVRRVGHRHDQAALVPCHRQGLVAAGQGVGDEPRRAGVDGELAEVEEVEGCHQIRLGDQLLVDEDAPERLARPRLLVQRRRQLLAGEQLTGDEQLPQLVGVRHHATRRRGRRAPAEVLHRADAWATTMLTVTSGPTTGT